MLHLFNKVYLEFDTNIEINFDRIVISEKYGIPIYDQITAYGELIAYGKKYEDVVQESIVGFISAIKDHGNRTGKKIVIYCDREAYKKFIAQWFKAILPNLDFKSFKTLADYSVYNQRIISNTQLSSIHSMDLNSIWEDIGDIKSQWEEAKQLTDNETESLQNIGLNYSYEFLMSTQLSGDGKYQQALRKTMHMFLRRWFKEMFTDNRQMVLLNLTNHKMQKAMGVDPKLVDVTRIDPLAGIAVFDSYADDEIWERDQTAYGVCKLEGLSDEKALALVDTFINVHEKFEGISVDRSVYSLRPFVLAATRDDFTDAEFGSLLEYFINEPFDTIGIPRFDFQNVNFPLLQYFLSQRFNGKDLKKYRLL